MKHLLYRFLDDGMRIVGIVGDKYEVHPIIISMFLAHIRFIRAGEQMPDDLLIYLFFIDSTDIYRGPIK